LRILDNICVTSLSNFIKNLFTAKPKDLRLLLDILQASVQYTDIGKHLVGVTTDRYLAFNIA